MNDPVLLRIVWKEYRQLRALWLVVAALVILVQGLTLVFSLATDGDVPTDELFGIGLFMPVLYALGCGAVLFAGEHESGTYDFQRALPLSASRLAIGKIGLGVFSALLMPLLLCLTAWLLAGGRLPAIPSHYGLGVVGTIVIIELFAWSVLWSLLLGRVLWAVVLSAASTLLVSFLALPFLLSPALRDLLPFHVDEFTASMPVRAGFGLLLLVVSFWLARRWLREYPSPWDHPRRDRHTQALDDRRYAASGLSSWHRLIWQAWMQSRVTLAMILGFAVLASLFFIVHAIFSLRGPIEAFRFPLIFAVGVAGFVGSTIFWSDQRNGQYLFLAERGVSPRRVWASRQVIGVAAVTVYYAFALVCLAGDLANSHSPFRIEQIMSSDTSVAPLAYQVSREAVLHLFSFVGLGVLLYSVGQACSLMIRSGPIALFVGLICGWAVALWATAMWHLEVPLWFSVAPIPIAMLWASWLRAPDWMNGRVRWRHRWKLLLSVAIPIAGVVSAMVAYRVYEIPHRQPPFSADELDRMPSPAALATADEYEQIYLEYTRDNRETTPSDSEQQQAEERMVARFVAATGRAECVVPTIQLQEYLHAHGSDVNINAGTFAAILTDRVLESCGRLDEEGRLDESVERYLAVLAFSRQYRNQGDWHRQWQVDRIEANVLQSMVYWAASAGQTPQRIREAIKRLDEEHLSVPVPRREAVIQDYRWDRDQLDMRPWVTNSMTPHDAFSVWFTSRFMPWEHARLQRLLNASTTAELRYLESAESLLESGDGLLRFDFRTPQQPMQRWLRTTPLFSGASLSGSTWDAILGRFELSRRVGRLQLELAAWRAEHGELPKTLDQLSEAEELPAGYIDPFTGVALRYRPDGIGQSIKFRPASPFEVAATSRSDEVVLEAGTAFLWSGGSSIFYSPRKGPRDRGPREPNFGDFFYRPSGSETAFDITSEIELLSLGQVFPIPNPASKE